MLFHYNLYNNPRKYDSYFRHEEAEASENLHRIQQLLRGRGIQI